MPQLSFPSSSTIAVSSTVPAVAYLGYLLYTRGRERSELPSSPSQSSPVNFGQLMDRLSKVQRSRLDTIVEEPHGENKQPWN